MGLPRKKKKDQSMGLFITSDDDTFSRIIYLCLFSEQNHIITFGLNHEGK